jgi:outer membrane usher protein
VLSAVVAGLLALATLPPCAASAADRHAIFPMTVNGVDKGDRVVVLRDGDVLVRVADLEQAGLRRFDGRREPIAGEAFVSLSSLAPGTTFDLDEITLTLRLTVDPHLLDTTVIALLSSRPAGISYESSPSLFFNYALTWQDFDRLDPFGFVESGLSLGRTVLYSSASRAQDGSLARGLTNWTFDDVSNMRRWVAGDSFAGSGGLGGGLLLGGVSVSRNFSLDPYFIRFPTPGLSGAALSPSTVDVYVNGVLVSRTDVPPGPFDIRNLPATAGSGFTRLVIRDAFGREQEVGSPYYLATGVLSEGLQEYSYNLGFERKSLVTAAGEYGAPAFLGTHRLGLSDWLTVGARLEAAADLVSAGPSLALMTALGEIDLEVAASGRHGHGGGAGLISYQYLGRRFSFGGFARGFSPQYTNLSLDVGADHPRADVSLFAGVQLLPRVSLNVGCTATDQRDQGWVNQLNVSTSIALSDRLSAFLSVSPKLPGSPNAGLTGRPETIAFIGLSYFFGGTTTANVFREQEGKQGQTGIEVQKPLPVGTGLGYRVHGDLGDDRFGGNGLLQYQGPWGLYSLNYDREQGHDSASATVAGGLVAIGGALHATRPVSDSFALIRVPGVAGVRGYLNNQEVGRTDSDGDLFVPNMLSYYGNRLRIEDTDLPLNYSVGAREQVVAPPYHGGLLLPFSVQRVQSFTGTIVIDTPAGDLFPAYGELTVTAKGAAFVSPLGKRGQFYLQNVPAGRHTARVRYDGGECDFILEIPEKDAPFVGLEPQRCQTSEKRGIS